MGTSNVTPVERALRVIVGIATFVALTPVLGMLLVFAILPALPVALLVAVALLEPIKPSEYAHGVTEQEAEDLAWRAAHPLPSVG